MSPSNQVKKTLEEYFKALPASDKTTEDANSQPYTPLEVGQHLNGDEAMALGAAFRAANLSTAFRVRKVSTHTLLFSSTPIDFIESSMLLSLL